MVDNCARILGRTGYDCVTTTDPRRALELLESERPDVLLTDLKMPEVDGMALLRRAQELDPALPVIVVTAFATIESAVAAIKEGAFDYLPKNFSVEQLRVAVERAVRHRGLQVENRNLRAQLQQALGSREHHRLEPGHDPGVRAGEEGGALGGQHPGGRRVGHRQGAGRPRHPRQQPAGRPGLRARRLRVASRAAARVRAVRPREGRLHRRRAQQARSHGGGAPGHAVPGRDRRATRDAPGQDAARAAGAPDPPRGRHRAGGRRRRAWSPPPTATCATP